MTRLLTKCLNLYQLKKTSFNMDMIHVTKNGHEHEFSPEAWERMGTGNIRMGWALISESTSPPEVQVLKQKIEETANVVELKRKSQEVLVEETIVDEPVVTKKKKK